MGRWVGNGRSRGKGNCNRKYYVWGRNMFLIKVRKFCLTARKLWQLSCLELYDPTYKGNTENRREREMRKSEKEMG